MNISKNLFLVLALLFCVSFIYSIFDEEKSHELFFLEVNIWIYRLYRFLLVVLFLYLYFKQKKIDRKNNLNKP